MPTPEESVTMMFPDLRSKRADVAAGVLALSVFARAFAFPKRLG
jgi:hypothetical protein